MDRQRTARATSDSRKARRCAVGGLLLGLALLTLLNANTLAVHMGATGHATPAASGAEPPLTQPLGAAGVTSSHDTEAGPLAGPGPGGHLLHVLGACAALLAAGLLLSVRAGRVVPRRLASQDARPRAGVRAPGRQRAPWRGPPALRPPVTSRVLRT